MKRVLALLALVAGCEGQRGVIDLGLTTAPGSTLLDGVQRLRVRLSNPPYAAEAVRTDDGFELALEVEAMGETGSLHVEGFDDTGALVASGSSPPFSVSSLDARIVVYMAVPMSIASTPVGFASAREAVAATTLPYGTVLAGGRDLATGDTLDELVIYNAYDHTIAAGAALPAPRAELGIAAGLNQLVYMFGGVDAAGTPSGALWRFDTNIAPAGAYTELEPQPALARTGTQVVHVGNDRFVITGTPSVDLFGGTLTPREDVTSLGPAGAGLIASDGGPAAVFAGEHGIARYRLGTIAVLDTTSRPGARVVVLPGGDALVIDPTGPALRVDPVTDEVTPVASVTAGCAAPTAASTARHVVVACPTATTIYDAVTLEIDASLSTGGRTLTALPNGQVLMLVGGQLALFTPPTPAS